MGKAVFYGGEFYVLGGETLNGSLATPADVYNRVDIYNPTTNSWRLGPIMPTARHGIFPLLQSGRIYVAGGGVHSGDSQSAVLEVFNIAAPATPQPAPITRSTNGHVRVLFASLAEVLSPHNGPSREAGNAVTCLPVEPGQAYAGFTAVAASGPAVWSAPVPFMATDPVRTLDAVLHLRAEAQVEEGVKDHEYGRLGWAADTEGNRFELWQPG
jgi:hypothetical protein